MLKTQIPSTEFSIKILIISSIGALFECYDFMICAFLSTFLTKLFYPENQLLGIFTIFTIGFFSRPIGGMFWGHIGDRHGRKKVFSLTMILLALPTLLIAFFPLQWFSIKVAGISFAILRFFQGFLVARVVKKNRAHTHTFLFFASPEKCTFSLTCTN